MAISDITTKLLSPFSRASEQERKSFLRLSTGSRINKASDDAAGLAIASSLDAIAVTSRQAARNANDGNSIADIAEGTLQNVANITTRQAELASQAANGTLSDDQRAALNQEYQALEQEKLRQIETAEFNGTKVFNTSGTTLQVGTTGGAESQITVPSASTASLSASQPNILSAEAARAALDDLQNKVGETSSLLGQIGASVSRLEVAKKAAQDSEVESRAASSRIRDVDVAEEVSKKVAASILVQSGTALQAQANLNSRTVLSLLK
ncbi:MAG: flagellin FliC [Proteobacteria bacterium]|nr:MAG: flagellin FliC [Pseudomonadota bacterium]